MRRFLHNNNTTKVRDLDVIVPLPSTQNNATRISTTRIYFAFFRCRNDRLNEFVILIYVYDKCYAISSYLYYIILVNKKNNSEE